MFEKLQELHELQELRAKLPRMNGELGKWLVKGW